MAKYTDKKKASNLKWDSNNLDRISIAIPKGQKDTVKAAAAQRGESVNAYIYRAVLERMERDGFGISSPSVDM